LVNKHLTDSAKKDIGRGPICHINSSFWNAYAKVLYKIYCHFKNGTTENDHSAIYVWFQTLPDAQTKTVR